MEILFTGFAQLHLKVIVLSEFDIDIPNVNSVSLRGAFSFVRAKSTYSMFDFQLLSRCIL